MRTYYRSAQAALVVAVGVCTSARAVPMAANRPAVHSVAQFATNELYLQTSHTSLIRRDTFMIPITMSISANTVSSGGTLTCSVTVDEIPASGGYVLVGCSKSGLLSPSNGTLPYSLTYVSGGSTTATCALTAGSVSSPTSATVFACPANANPADPSQWSVVGTLTVQPVCAAR